MTKTVKRLFEQFKPEHYVLDIDIDKSGLRFSGTVIISGHKTGRPAKRLTLHQSGLKVTAARITSHTKDGDSEVSLKRINCHEKFEEVRLHTESELYPGRYTLTLEFNGRITKQMNGIYPCFFKHDGRDKTLIATQFESHHAREVFPCIDEPEAKATFDLKLTTPKEEVVANTPVKLQTEKDGRRVTEFERTPKMSTYLLAFIVGEMRYLEAKTKDGVVVRTYATPDNIDLTSFALDTAVKCLEFFNGYFDISYPLPKCDLIALPDFASGAMENWGCITFREHALFVDEEHTSLATRQYVAMVVAHELAHQWFGNLVTMRWWTDLWLNEGFASWIEYLAVDELFSDWQMWTQFIAEEQQQALKLDALEHTHPIEVPIKHPDEIRAIFDAISYSKGSSVINMLHEYLGHEAFQSGLRYYLKKHEYGNTDTPDLWAALEEASKKPVKSFMHEWTSLAGFPLLQANFENGQLSLKQSRFFLNGSSKAAKEERTVWPIPLLAGGQLNNDALSAPELTYEKVEAGGFKLNQGQSGFYRVVYNASQLASFADQIKRGRLPVRDRLGLLSDVFEAAKAGHMDTVDALTLLEAYEDETDAAVWEVISLQLASLRAIMDDEALREAMKPSIRKLVSKQLERLGWQATKGESHFDVLLRPTILGMAAMADEPGVVKEALRLFASIEHPEEIPAELRISEPEVSIRRGPAINPDLRGVVYGTAVRLGGEKEFKKLLAMHNASSLSEERTTIAAALTGFKQPELITAALARIDTPDVRLQDVAYWVAYSFANRHAKLATWQWLKDHWDWLEKNLGTDLSFYRMPVYSARAFSDRKFLDEFKRFFEPRLSPALDRSYRQGLETIEWQSDWKKRDIKAVKHYFASKP